MWRWALVVIVALYVFGAAGTFIAVVSSQKLPPRERTVAAAAERSLLWPARLVDLARSLVETK